MPNTAVLDVLIVYNGATASSAADPTALVPFSLASQNVPCNDTYLYMLSYCHVLGLRAGFSTSADIIGPGRVSSYWDILKGAWHQVHTPAYAMQIFDKFSPKNAVGRKLRAKLFATPLVSPYNSLAIFEQFFDKQQTYDAHLSSAIPTLSLLRPTLVHITLQCQALAVLCSLSGSPDYTEQIILKDRFGAGGWHVYKLVARDYIGIRRIMQTNPSISFIIQPFTLFDERDIRLIYLGGVLVQSYFRTAARGDFRCNAHQGGTSTYLDLDQIPLNIRSQADLIVSTLDHVNSLFALDFVVGRSGQVHFIEGNTGPGLSWDKTIAKEVSMGKQLIRAIVKNLATRLNTTKSIYLYQSASYFTGKDPVSYISPTT